MWSNTSLVLSLRILLGGDCRGAYGLPVSSSLLFCDPFLDDVLTKDAGECVICLEELLQGDTIARLPCLCIYHKRYSSRRMPVTWEAKRWHREEGRVSCWFPSPQENSCCQVLFVPGNC